MSVNRVPWISNVPEHWNDWRISWAFASTGSGTTPTSEGVEYYDGDVPWVTTGELRENTISETRKSLSSQALTDFPALRIFPVGTILVAMYGATIGRIATLGIPATTNQACCALVPPSKIYERFAFHWLNNFRQEIVSLASGGGQPNINQEKIRSLRIPVPDLATQKAIADFLDRETARIDQLIEKKQQLVQTLEFRRQTVLDAMIAGTPAQGNNLKSISVPWIHEVPVGWDVLPLKRVVGMPITDGPHETPQFVEGGVPFISAEAIQDGAIDFDRKRGFITDEANQIYSRKYRPASGDIYVVKSGATTGKSAMVGEFVDFNIWSPLAVLRPGPRMIGDYLLATIRSSMFQNAIALNWSWGTQQNIGMGTLGEIKIPVPSVEEQSALLSEFRAEMHLVDPVIEITKRSVTLLRESRSSLITHTVTGQLDIAAWTKRGETERQLEAVEASV